MGWKNILWFVSTSWKVSCKFTYRRVRNKKKWL